MPGRASPHVEADAELTEKFPRMRAARVEIELEDGTKLQHFAPYRRGDPEAPLTDAELEGKFIELSEPVIGSRAAKELLAALWRIDSSTPRELGLARLSAVQAAAA